MVHLRLLRLMQREGSPFQRPSFKQGFRARTWALWCLGFLHGRMQACRLWRSEGLAGCERVSCWCARACWFLLGVAEQACCAVLLQQLVFASLSGGSDCCRLALLVFLALHLRSWQRKSSQKRELEMIKSLDPDLAGLLQCKEVSLKTQALLASKKVETISRLSAMVDDRKAVQEFCAKALGLAPDAPESMVEVASVVDAWESACMRVEARNKAEAEAVVGGLPKVVARTELAQLRERFEASFYSLPDKLMPANATLEQHFDMVDNGEFQYLSLKVYASREDAAREPFAASIDRSTGTIKVRKGQVAVPLPRTAEELRLRLRLVPHAFVLCSLRYPHVASLKGIAPSHLQLRRLSFGRLRSGFASSGCSRCRSVFTGFAADAGLRVPTAQKHDEGFERGQESGVSHGAIYGRFGSQGALFLSPPVL